MCEWISRDSSASAAPGRKNDSSRRTKRRMVVIGLSTSKPGPEHALHAPLGRQVKNYCSRSNSSLLFNIRKSLLSESVGESQSARDVARACELTTTTAASVADSYEPRAAWMAG